MKLGLRIADIAEHVAVHSQLSEESPRQPGNSLTAQDVFSCISLRNNQVREENRDLLVFSRASHLCEWRAALVTELGVRWQFGAARPTQQPRRGQSTATIPAGVHVSIISPLVNDRAAHHWSQAKLKTQAGFFQRLHWPAGGASGLAFSQPAIVVRSVVPSSNFPESGRAAKATAIIPPFGATSTPICPTRELPGQLTNPA
jgi:hypothetical protein